MNNVQNSAKILIYTRTPKDEYTESLANSIHFAYCDGQDEFIPLNQNYGILFALSTIDERNVIREKGVKNPYLFRLSDGSFGILAVRVASRGIEDEESKGQILLWTSENLIDFKDFGLLKLHNDLFVKEAVCEYNASEKTYEIRWQDNEGNFYINRIQDLAHKDSISSPESSNSYKIENSDVNLSDILPGNILAVESGTAEAFKAYWTPLYNTGIRTPDSIKVKSAQELGALKATAIYSDGSTDDKCVELDISGIDFSVPGTYEIKGKAVQEIYQFPLTHGYADPVTLPWDNKYYFISTNDNSRNIGLYVRESDNLHDLFAPGFKESIILNYDEEKNFIQTFWAPEFHIIGGELYILFAVGGKQWAPQCHMMKLKKGGDIMNASDWDTPVRVKLADGTPLGQGGITLDMTYFKADGTSCLLWSYRKGIGSPLDTGSMIYIATVDENNPTVLTSDPVLLSRPLFGWENIQRTINNEGPYPLITDDMVYITYSGGAAGGYTYALGLLSIPRGSDYLNINLWKKANAPVLSYYSIEGIYGPGHNSFFRDYNGNTMIMYHVEKEIVRNGQRCSAMHRVHFNKDGIPKFNVAKERDLNPKTADFSIKVIVE